MGGKKSKQKGEELPSEFFDMFSYESSDESDSLSDGEGVNLLFLKMEKVRIGAPPPRDMPPLQRYNPEAYESYNNLCGHCDRYISGKPFMIIPEHFRLAKKFATNGVVVICSDRCHGAYMKEWLRQQEGAEKERRAREIAQFVIGDADDEA